MKMKKRFLAPLLVSSLAIALVSCANVETAEQVASVEPTATPIEAVEETVSITKGEAVYILMNTILTDSETPITMEDFENVSVLDLSEEEIYDSLNKALDFGLVESVDGYNSAIDGNTLLSLVLTSTLLTQDHATQSQPEESSPAPEVEAPQEESQTPSEEVSTPATPVPATPAPSTQTPEEAEAAAAAKGFVISTSEEVFGMSAEEMRIESAKDPVHHAQLR